MGVIVDDMSTHPGGIIRYVDGSVYVFHTYFLCVLVSHLYYVNISGVSSGARNTPEHVLDFHRRTGNDRRLGNS